MKTRFVDRCSMFALLAACVWLLTRPASAAQTTGPVEGAWQGQIAVGGTAIPFAAVFTAGANGLTATMDIQGAKALPLRAVKAEGTSVHFELPAGLGLAIFDGTLGPNGLSGAFTQGAARGTFTMTRGSAPAAAPAGPPPYHVEDLTYRNGGVTLAATLTIPEGKGPFPAVVMATGSGQQNRDEELSGFKIFGVIADYLTRHGVAVLRADDRGIGGSSGPVASATTVDFAEDALAGVAFLTARSEIDHGRVGVFGHSEGGDIAVIAAEQAAFHTVVEDVRSHANSADVQAHVRAWVGTQYDWLPAPARAQLGDRSAFLDKQMVAALAQISAPWMQYTLTFDPATVLRTVKCPVLALFGGKDTQVVAATNRPALERALAEAGNTHLTVKMYPDANHLFIPAITGQVSEYATLPKTFVPGFLEDAASWILAVK